MARLRCKTVGGTALDAAPLDYAYRRLAIEAIRAALMDVDRGIGYDAIGWLRRDGMGWWDLLGFDTNVLKDWLDKAERERQLSNQRATRRGRPHKTLIVVAQPEVFENGLASNWLAEETAVMR